MVVSIMFCILFLLLINLCGERHDMKKRVYKSFPLIICLICTAGIDKFFQSEFLIQLQLVLSVTFIVGVNLYARRNSSKFSKDEGHGLHRLDVYPPIASLDEVQYLWYDSGEMNCHCQDRNENKYIIFTSRALNSLSREELRAMTYHELGHLRGKHLRICFAIKMFQNIIYAFLLFSLVYLFVFDYLQLFELVCMTFLSTRLFMIACNLFNRLVSRQQEYAADKYALRNVSKKQLISALLAISGKEMNDMYACHPSVKKRIKRIVSYV